MSDRLEGTLRLEGLIEGPVPPFPDAKQRIEKWAQEFTGGVIPLSVQFDGGHFSAMPGNEPVGVRAISPSGLEPANAIADGIDALLRYFPPLERGQVFSTLRSLEYRPRQEVQTLYAVGPDGRPATRQQIVPCETVKPPEPVGRKEMMKNGIIGLLLAAVILGISTFFVPYRSIWRQLTARVEPATTTVDADGFAPYFTLQVTGLDLRDGTLQLKLTRTALYPRDEAGFDALYSNPPMPAAATAPAATVSPAAPATMPTSTPASASAPASSPAQEMPSLLRRRLAIESLAKGIVWLDFYDKDGNLIGGASVRVGELEKKETLEVAVAAPVVNRQSVAPARVTVAPQ